MTAAAPELVSVREVDEDTPCRGCADPIRPGQRAALVLGRGQLHLRCLLTLTTDATDATEGHDADAQ